MKNEENDDDRIEEPSMSRREIVVPGECLGERNGRKLGRGVYIEDEKIYAKIVGIPIINENEIKLIPMSGAYMPVINDNIIGIISKIESSGWLVDIASPYEAYLPVSDGVDEFVDIHKTDLSRFFDIGDVIFCKLSKVTRDGSVRASMRSLGARKLFGGVVMDIEPTKVPRIIGRGGSMINMIKERTDSVIYVGKNGLIWIRGDNKEKAIEAIKIIEKESHSTGLTDRIEKLLDVQGEENDEN